MIHLHQHIHLHPIHNRIHDEDKNINFLITGIEEAGFESLLYALKYCNITSHSHDLQDLSKLNRIISIKSHHPHNAEEYSEYLLGAGFKLDDADVCYNLFTPFSSGFSGSNVDENWLHILEYVPVLKEKVREIVSERIPKRIYPKSILDKIKSIYPELYPIAKTSSRKNNAKSEFCNLLPNVQYQNDGVSRTPLPKSMKRDEPNFQWIFDTYWEDIKDFKWGGGIYNSIEESIYLIFILCKLGKYKQIGELNIYWNYPYVGKVIRAALNMYNRNSRSVIHTSYSLNPNEREELFKWMLTNVEVKTYISTESKDDPMIRHNAFSLIYYIYDWGFDRYLKLVENTKKNHYINIKGTPTMKTVRIDYLEHVLTYMCREGQWDEFRSLVKTLLSWKMDKFEKDETIRELKYLPIGDENATIKNKILFQQFGIHIEKESSW